MEKNKVQGIIVMVLFFTAFLIWVYPHLTKRGTISRTVAKEYGIDIEGAISTEDFFESQKRLEEKRPGLLWTRDPFQLPPKGPQKAEFGISNLVLSGIAVDENGKMAVINDEIVREGDVVFGVRIIRIREDTVTVEKEGKSYDLKLF